MGDKYYPLFSFYYALNLNLRHFYVYHEQIIILKKKVFKKGFYAILKNLTKNVWNFGKNVLLLWCEKADIYKKRNEKKLKNNYSNACVYEIKCLSLHR